MKTLTKKLATLRFYTTMKEVSTNRYEVAVLADQDGMYSIAYRTSMEDRPKYSEQIQDYNMASRLFEMKLAELEGQ